MSSTTETSSMMMSIEKDASVPKPRRTDCLKRRCSKRCWVKCCKGCGCCCVVFWILLGIVYGILCAAATSARPRASVAVLPSPTVLAHRGSIGLWPESTLFTFANTLALDERNVLEMDLRLSADGHVVVLHDSTTTRSCNGGGSVHEMDLADLQALDAGWWWGTGERYSRGSDQRGNVEWATYPFRGLGLQIPRLAEVLSTFPNASKLVDLKSQPGSAEPSGVPQALIQSTCDEIMASGLSPPQHERVIVASFHEDALVRFREACPQVATGQGIMGTAGLWAASIFGAESAYSPSGETVQGPRYFSLGPLRNVEVMTARFLDAARNRNMHSSAYDVEDPALMRLLLGRGVGGVITDRIDLAMSVMGRLDASAVSTLADIKSVGTSCACSAGGHSVRMKAEAGCALIGRQDTPAGASWQAPVTTFSCPSEAEVMATPFDERWGKWDDPSCSACVDVIPCGDQAPCCLKGTVLTVQNSTRCEADAMPSSTAPPRGGLHREDEL